MKAKNSIALMFMLASAFVAVAAFVSYAAENAVIAPSRLELAAQREREGRKGPIREAAAPADITQPETAAVSSDAEDAAATEADETSAQEEDCTVTYPEGEGKGGTVVGSEAEGYRFMNADGVKDDSFCGSVEVDGVTWNVICGKAEKVVTESDKTLNYALRALAACTRSGMSGEEKLKNAFHYLQDNYLEGSRREFYRELDWPVVYANDLLVGGKGDCYSYAAAFAYMAKGIGYEEVYACNSGGHGWAEIDGKIYDPEWSMHSKRYSYFGMSYSDPCDLEYGESINSTGWMHVKI